MSCVAASSATRGPAGAGCWLNVALVDGMGTTGHLVPGRSASTATTDSVPLAHSPSLDGLPQKIPPAVAVPACLARALPSDGSATGCIHRVTRRVDSVDVPGAAVVPSPCSVGVDEGDRCVAESSFPKQSAAAKYRAAFVASHHDMGLQALSTDLLQHVLSFLTAADWGAARATSRTLCAVAESPAALDAMFANSVALPRLGRSLGACLSIIRFVNPAAWAVDVYVAPRWRAVVPLSHALCVCAASASWARRACLARFHGPSSAPVVDWAQVASMGPKPAPARGRWPGVTTLHTPARPGFVGVRGLRSAPSVACVAQHPAAARGVFPGPKSCPCLKS